MKRLTSLALALLLGTTGTALGATGTEYYTDSQHPGRHWTCDKSTVAYENNEVVVLCEGLELHKVGSGRKRRYEGSYAEGTVLVKGPVNSPETRTQEELDRVAYDTFNTSFYDSAEKRQVRALGGALLFDLATTLVGVGGGRCTEGGAVAAHIPVLSLAINGYYFYDTRRSARQTARYFTTSKNWEPWLPTVTHTYAGIHNLAKCIL